MSTFGLDHLSPLAPKDITAGPSVGWGEGISAGFNQAFQVNSPLSLEQEVMNDWLDNLSRLEEKTGERFEMPRASELEEASLGDLQAYMRYVAGEGNVFNRATSMQSPEERLAMFQRADERIKELGDPEIQSFADIVAGVYQMQQEIEGKSAEVTERGDFLGQMIGSIAGSFSTRDPLSLYTLTMGGAGRNVATRIASEMGVAGAVVGASDVAYVNPNRARAGLPELDLLYDVAAGAIGAGLFRGGIEGIGAAARGVRGAPIDIDFRDTQLAQMFEAAPQSPRARAGLAALDDIQFVERNNPYGAGQAAQERFIAELQDVQRVLGGAPMTAIARVLPPVPFEYIKDAADFQLVKEQAPKVWSRLEEAQARVAELDARIETADVSFESRVVTENPKEMSRELLEERNPTAVRRLRFEVDDARRATVETEYRQELETAEAERQAETSIGEVVEPDVKAVRRERRAAKAAYRTAYAAVEAEAARINRVQAALRGQQQADTLDLLGNSMGGRTFVGSALSHGMVESHMARVLELAETQDERAVALFKEREDFSTGEEGETKPLAYETDDGRIDIGLAEPVDPDFKLITEDGEFTVRQIMDDLKEDERLDEAMRTCLL